MSQDYFMLSNQYSSSEEGSSQSSADLNTNQSLNRSGDVITYKQLSTQNTFPSQSLTQITLEKKKTIKKPSSTNSQSSTKKRKQKCAKDQQTQEEQDEPAQPVSSVTQCQEIAILKEKQFNINVFQYQIRSNIRFFLSSSKVLNMEWFTKDPYEVYDNELFSDFNPVEQVIYHKREGVYELVQPFNQYPPDNYEYVVKCLDSLSCQNAHLLSQLIQESLKRKSAQSGVAIQQNIHSQRPALEDINELKKRALEVIEQLDSQKIFSYNIFVQDFSSDPIKKIAQGYSEGFLKMIGATKQTFTSFVMKHKGFEAFNGKSRLNTLYMTLSKELGVNFNGFLDRTAQVKTFDDYILTLTPMMKFIPLNETQTSFIVISNFDIDINQLLLLENIRKKEQQAHFQQDFRYQCQVQNFVEKFYPNTNDESNNKQLLC